ncbi:MULTISPECIES: ExbD/TolR family protein [unclassified Caballeronia]|uniref:ExbD/TolR family protein n=1 Tax=unclassified Caballeronia TaxID=2646786 RepID=UPI003ECE6CE5
MLSEINITPLVDVMLVLLVTFIITAPLLNNAVRVNLPKTAATAPPEQKRPVTVGIDARGAVFFDKRAVALPLVETQLKALKQADPDVALSLQADQNVPCSAPTASAGIVA